MTLYKVVINNIVLDLERKKTVYEIFFAKRDKSLR